MIKFNGADLDCIKFYMLISVGIIAATFSWITFYVIPTSEWNNTIMNCQLELDDRSYESYEYCVELNKPRSTLMAR